VKHQKEQEQKIDVMAQSLTKLMQEVPLFLMSEVPLYDKEVKQKRLKSLTKLMQEVKHSFSPPRTLQ